MKGHMGRILFVNLTARTHWQRGLPSSLAEALIGGKGLGVKLLYDLLPPGTDPLDPANPLIIVSGPLCVFRRNRPRSPEEDVHSFRVKSSSCSGPNRPPVPAQGIQ